MTLENVGKKMVEAAQKAVPNVPLKEAHDRLAAGEEIVVYPGEGIAEGRRIAAR